MMCLLRGITHGVTDRSVYRRIGWMYVSFFLLHVSVTVVSNYLLPEAILRGKHPIISRLQFSPNVWTSTPQIFGYNLIPTTLIIAGNLLSQQSRLVKERFVPIGYTAFWGLTILFAVITGSWSFDVVTASPPLHCRLVRMLDIFHHSGLLESSAYLLAAVVSFKFTLWYSDKKRMTASRRRRDVRLTKSEKVFLILAFVLLFCGAYVESYAMIQVAG
ncbi:MAG: stage II sporulation protein M [Anaerolineae bacterium]|jgi:hypothetical protein